MTSFTLISAFVAVCIIWIVEGSASDGAIYFPDQLKDYKQLRIKSRNVVVITSTTPSSTTTTTTTSQPDIKESSCNTPSGGNGVCKSIFECKSLLALVNKTNRTPQETDLLKKSQCGFQGTVPSVCCPEPCYTPDGLPGSCISIYSCQNLADLLKPPVSKYNMDYVQNSKCVGPDQYSVCCGPPRILNKPGRNGECQDTVTAFPPQPHTECCGIDSRVGNKIVGGNATTVDQYPWLVIIEYVKLGTTKLLCGGTLISGRYVLTAGHCVTGDVLNYGTPNNVRLGEYDTQHDGADCAPVEAGGMDCTEGMISVPIETTIPHPEYNPRAANKRHDIALIRLRQMAPFTEFIRPICLPTMDLTAAPPVNFTLFAAGWGAVSTTQPKSNVKLQVDLPFASEQVCRSAYRSSGVNLDLWRGQLCAGGEQGKDSCKGDSGGPLMYENGLSYEIVGVVSYGPTACGSKGIPGIYTKVFEYNSWIRSNIKP